MSYGQTPNSYAARVGDDGATHPASQEVARSRRHWDDQSDLVEFNAEMQVKAIAFLKDCRRIVWDDILERWVLT